MIEAILTLNAGSSSVKFSLFAKESGLPLLAEGSVADIGGKPVFKAIEQDNQLTSTHPLATVATHETAIRQIFDWIHGHEKKWRIAIVTHRIVHGGTEFTKPIRTNAESVKKLKQLSPLAPLHQPHNLAALVIAERLLAHIPQIACFDTAFHAQHDPLFTTYALPQDLRDKGIRRYGFHGLSYEWITHVLKEKHAHLADKRIVAAHLGNGASACAMLNGKSIDTTMGMTALEGLPMGTRCGSIDPAAVIYMIRTLSMPPDETEHTLYEKSGLKGLSGISNDVRELLASSDHHAKFSLDFFALKTAQHIAQMAVSISGLDTIIFTGGIGENATPVREAILQHLSFLGKPEFLIIPANEERMMAIHTLALSA